MEDKEDKAVGFDYPNHVSPSHYNHIHRGVVHISCPTNHAAKMTDHEKVMRATREGK